MPLATTILADAGRNFTLRITGCLARSEPIDPVMLPDRMRLSAAVWLIQEKAGLRLMWQQTSDPSDLLLIMESRNAVRYEPGLQPPRDWDKRLHLAAFGLDRVPEPPCWFTLTLDFDK